MIAPRFTVRSLFVLVTVCALASLVLASAQSSMVWQAVATVLVGTVLGLGLLCLMHLLVYLAVHLLLTASRRRKNP